MRSITLVSILFASSIAFAGAADDIDSLFEKAGSAEKAGDCTSASDAYGQIELLAQSLPVGDQSRVLSQVKSRQTRKKACVEACTLSTKEKAVFESAKKAKADGETKRVAEMCKQLLHGKNAKCSTVEEIRSFCPSMEAADPCTNVSSETKAEMEKLDGDVNALQGKVAAAQKAAKGGSARALDNVLSLNREMEEAADRLFDMRERYFHCDKVYGGLKDKAYNIGQSRAGLRTAAAQGIKNSIGRMTAQLADLKKQNEELAKTSDDAGKKVEALTNLTNDLALDIIGMAQASSVAMTVKVEGAKEAADALPKVLAGDREAMEAMIKKHPEYFNDGSGRPGLVKKKESLERLDKVLARLAEQGQGERLGFKKAQQELSASLSLVKSAIGPEGDAKHASSGFPWTSVGIFGAFAVGIFLVIMLMRGRPDKEATAFSLSSAGGPALAAAGPSELAPKKSARTGLGLGDISPSKPTAKAAKGEKKTGLGLDAIVSTKPVAKKSGLGLDSLQVTPKAKPAGAVAAKPSSGPTGKINKLDELRAKMELNPEATVLEAQDPKFAERAAAEKAAVEKAVAEKAAAEKAAAEKAAAEKAAEKAAAEKAARDAAERAEREAAARAAREAAERAEREAVAKAAREAAEREAAALARAAAEKAAAEEAAAEAAEREAVARAAREAEAREAAASKAARSVPPPIPADAKVVTVASASKPRPKFHNPVPTFGFAKKK